MMILTNLLLAVVLALTSGLLYDFDCKTGKWRQSYLAGFFVAVTAVPLQVVMHRAFKDEAYAYYLFFLIAALVAFALCVASSLFWRKMRICLAWTRQSPSKRSDSSGAPEE